MTNTGNSSSATPGRSRRGWWRVAFTVLVLGLIAAHALGGSGKPKRVFTGTVTVPATGSGQAATVIKSSVRISTQGQAYECPIAVITQKLDPLQQQLADLQVQLDRTLREFKQVKGQLARLNALYPQHNVPAHIAREYNGLLGTARGLVRANRAAAQQYIAIVARHNHLLDVDCTAG